MLIIVQVREVMIKLRRRKIYLVGEVQDGKYPREDQSGMLRSVFFLCKEDTGQEQQKIWGGEGSRGRNVKQVLGAGYSTISHDYDKLLYITTSLHDDTVKCSPTNTKPSGNNTLHRFLMTNVDYFIKTLVHLMEYER